MKEAQEITVALLFCAQMKTKPPEDESAKSQEVRILDVPKAVPFDARRQAQLMYWRGYDCKEISEELGINYNTVWSWKNRDKWDETPVIRRIELCLDAKLCQIILKPEYNPKDARDIDLLTRQIERLARVRRYEAGGNEADLNPKVANRNATPKKVKLKNFITAEQRQILLDAIEATLFDYQKEWCVAGIYKNRFILKSRQIGATFTIALDSLKRVLETGFDQIFISASRNQAKNFRAMICKFVFSKIGVELRGDPISMNIEGIENAASLHFLGTNVMTVQGYSGDVIIDECFWIYDFDKIHSVASAIATLSKFRRTFISTPSTIHHEAYPLWSGEKYNQKRAKADHIKINLDDEILKIGHLYGDNMWRQKVTIHDALAKGNHEIDIEELRNEKGVDEFRNIYECEFVDDSQSSFPMSKLRTCTVDAFEKWPDFKPFTARPYKEKVWLIHDPAHSDIGDPAATLVLAPPVKGASGSRAKFRPLEKLRFRGQSPEAQAKALEILYKKYDVEEIIVDKTGEGLAVFELVKKFFPRVVGLKYSPQLKNEMVWKAKQIIENGRLEFDAGWVDLMSALMSIHPKISKSGEQILYVSRRSAEVGHGELAWCLLMGLHNEPWGGESPKKSKMEFW